MGTSGVHGYKRGTNTKDRGHRMNTYWTLIIALEIVIMIADIMIASDMKKTIEITANMTIAKTNFHINTTRITIIAKLLMVPRTIVTRIARMKITQCMVTSFPTLAHEVGV